VILSQYGISAEPDVLRTAIQTDDILLIASDGLWNEMSSSEISAIALECKMAGFSPQKFCNMLLRRAEVVSKLKGISSDNITIVVYHHTY
jgi:serine/threonine protein phosphatase PrpC